MIWESGPWKDAIRSDATNLRDSINHGNDDGTLAKIERIVFVSAYSIRRLIESNKLTQRCLEHSVRCDKFPAISGKDPDHLNWHHIDRFFDLEKPEMTSVGIKMFCNQIIHSFIFAFSEEKEGVLDSILVTSERNKNDALFSFHTDEIFELMDLISSDVVASSRWERRKDGQFNIRNA